MFEILIAPLILIEALFSILYAEKIIVCIAGFSLIVTGALAYKLFFCNYKREELLKLLIKAKFSIIALGIPISFAFLVIFESIIYFITPSIFQKLPTIIRVFCTYGWLLDEPYYYLFLLEFTIYITISCSVFEYYILKEKLGRIYPKRQFIKAVLYSNIPVSLTAIGYFFCLFHSHPMKMM